MNGSKGKGYTTQVLNTDAGQSVFVRSCNGIGDLEPMFKHESIGGILIQLWKIMNDCPDLFPPDDQSMAEIPTVEEQREYADRVQSSPTLRYAGRSWHSSTMTRARCHAHSHDTL